jgi:DNA-binding IclR family transcriptional regulator
MKRASAPDTDGSGVTHRSLEHGLRLLEAVAVSGGASLTEVAGRTGLPRRTAHHLLQTLVTLGYLHQDPSSRGYVVGPTPLQLARAWSPEQLGELVAPYLAELTRRGREGSSLAVYRNGVITIAAKRERDGAVRVVQNATARRPVHCTAVGKAIAAWLPAHEVGELLARMRLRRHTPKTIATRADLEVELRRIRAAGYAVDDEEHVPGIRCIAMPIFGPAGEVVGSMCAVGPTSRVTPRKLWELRGPIAELARDFSRWLGAQKPAATPPGGEGA